MRFGAVEALFQWSLLLLVATGFGALASTGRIDRPTAAMISLALLARALLLAKGWRPPLSDRAVRILTVLYMGFYPVDFLYVSASFLDATVRLVLFLATVKLLAARAPRDYFHLGVIAFLELLSAAVLTISSQFLVFLSAFLVLAAAARASYEVCTPGGGTQSCGTGRGTARRLAVTSASLAAGIVPLTLVLFLVVPRVAIAYLSRLPASGEAVVGFSDEVNLGGAGPIRQSSAAVLRVTMIEGPPLPDLKWRGGALQYFDGVRWSNPSSHPQRLHSSQGLYVVAREAQRRLRLPQIQYRVLRAPMDSEALFLATIPASLAGDFHRLDVSPTDTLTLPGSRWRPLRYEGVSLVGSERTEALRRSHTGANYPLNIQGLFLQLPAGLDARIPKLARYITENQVSLYWRAAAIEHYLRTEYGYTLDQPQERPHDPLADFLFRRKRGHCEYFASAMAVMLRSVGIPARVATGFQSGDYNPLSNSYTVRANQAHAWVEAYFVDFGWVTFDPTPSAPRPAATGWTARLGLWTDALETWWQDWIIQYDTGRQLTLARMVQGRWLDAGESGGLVWERARRWIGRAQRQAARNPEWLVWPLAAAALVWAVRLAWPLVQAVLASRRVARGQASRQDCTLLYNRALRVLARRGFVRQPWQTPEEFLRVVEPRERRRLFADLTAAYERARFGGDAGAARRLGPLVRALERGVVE